ncbi:acyltransferase family protein [Cecembia sp.]|uniref:acyltransferase family protein n=1 Tax=Cecembia sp. TaxID=1898110 RepID=UPI0025BE8BCA|nr:acyltransferase family protein [Cecembia sp.]
MKTLSQKTERLHSLDSLRAIMMLLGIVLHGANTYGVLKTFGSAWPIQDPNSTHLSNDFISIFIHSYRMPIFFLVSGFFGALLFYERTPMKMLKNRVERIVLPFVVFLFLLWPFIYISFSYSGMVFAGIPDAMNLVLDSIFSDIKTLIPAMTFHLWFLYYLALTTFASVLLALVLKKLPGLTSAISKSFSWAIQQPVLRILVFGSITAILYSIMGTSSVDTSTSFIPDLNTFIFYFSFYAIGWILLKSKHLLDTFKRYDWINTILGIILFLLYFFMGSTFGYEAKIVLKSIMVWLFIFGFTGLFIRYASQHSAKMRYLSDSSYWVYLVHLPITAFIPGLIAEWPIPSTLKFLVVLISTTIICYVSYHYLVRGTFVGKFLNGRRYSGKLSDIKRAEELKLSNVNLVIEK